MSAMTGAGVAAVASGLVMPVPAADPDQGLPGACSVVASACAMGGPIGSAVSSVVGSAVGSVAGSVFEDAAAGFAEGAEKIIRDLFGWWLSTPSVSIAKSGVLTMQGLVLSVAAMLGVALVCVQGVRMMVTRRGTPLGELLWGSVVAAGIVAGGVAVVDLSLVAADQLATRILDHGFGSTDGLVDRVVAVLFNGGMGTAALMMIFAVLVIVMGLVQAVLFFLRQAAIPLLALLFPVVAAGQLGPPATRKWLPAVASATLAIIVYKPLVALVLAAGFVQIGEGESAVDVVRGFTTLALSVVALPALLRVFTPVVGRVAASGGSSGGLMGAGAAGMAVMAARGATPGDSTAKQHAAHMAERPGASAGSGSGSGSSASVWQVPGAQGTSSAAQGTSAAAAAKAGAAAHPAAAAAQVVVATAGRAKDTAAAQLAPDGEASP